MELYRMVFSPTGGTEKVASALSCGWDCEQETVNLPKVDRDYGVYKLEADDVYIMAVPSFGGKVPAMALKRSPSIKRNQARAVLTAVYGNRDFEDAPLELKDTLEAAGFRCVVAVAAIAEHSIIHQPAAGRPDEKGVARLKTFTEQIREKLKGDGTQGPAFAPGNRSYREYSGVPPRPKADRTRRQCDVCVGECPVHVTLREDMARTDEDMCISYMHCIAVCPSGSRKPNKVMMSVAAQELRKACMEPKQNELFLQLITEMEPGAPLRTRRSPRLCRNQSW